MRDQCIIDVKRETLYIKDNDSWLKMIIKKLLKML